MSSAAPQLVCERFPAVRGSWSCAKLPYMRRWTGFLVALALGLGLLVFHAPASRNDLLLAALDLVEQPVHAQRFRIVRGAPPEGAHVVQVSMLDIVAVSMLFVAAIGLPILLYLIFRGKSRTPRSGRGMREGATR